MWFKVEDFTHQFIEVDVGNGFHPHVAFERRSVCEEYTVHVGVFVVVAVIAFRVREEFCASIGCHEVPRIADGEYLCDASVVLVVPCFRDIFLVVCVETFDFLKVLIEDRFLSVERQDEYEGSVADDVVVFLVEVIGEDDVCVNGFHAVVAYHHHVHLQYQKVGQEMEWFMKTGKNQKFLVKNLLVYVKTGNFCSNR